MNTDPLAKSDEDVEAEILKPMEELLARADEALKKQDDRIREAERKGKSILDPEP